MNKFLLILSLLLFAALAFSQSLEQFTAQRNAELQKMLDERNAYIKESIEEREAYFKNYMKSQWEYWRKIPGVSLPASPDSLEIKTIEIQKIKEDENPNIEIIDALLKSGINETQAANIATEIIDSLGIDAIKEGQSIGIATEKNNAKNPVVVNYKVDSKENSTLVQGKYIETGENKAKKTSRNSCVTSKTEYVFPLKGTCRKTSGFGMREHPILKKPKKHDGVDYGAPKGTEVYAIAAGIVEISGYTDINGYYVAIKHADGMLSYYLHLNEKGIAKGSKVEAGQVIGKVGSTGRSTGPHLHLGIMKNGTWQNPEKIFE